MPSSTVSPRKQKNQAAAATNGTTGEEPEPQPKPKKEKVDEFGLHHVKHYHARLEVRLGVISARRRVPHVSTSPSTARLVGALT